MKLLKAEPLQREHMEQVIQLLQHISKFQPSQNTCEEIWEEFHSQPHVFSVVAISNGLVVGYGSIALEHKIRGGKMGHIEDIVSHPDHRNKGIGKIILDSLCEIATSKGCYKLALQCHENNLLFYERCGYKTSGIAMQRFMGI